MAEPWELLEARLREAAPPLPRVPRRLRRQVLQQARRAHHRTWRIERAQLTTAAVLLFVLAGSVAGYYGGILQNVYRNHMGDGTTETTAYRREVLESIDGSEEGELIEASKKLRDRGQRVITGAFVK